MILIGCYPRPMRLGMHATRVWFNVPNNQSISSRPDNIGKKIDTTEMC
jgi:hypothetical protein